VRRLIRIRSRCLGGNVIVAASCASLQRKNGLNDAVCARPMRSLGAAFHVEAAEQAPQMYFDSVLTDAQLFGDITIGQTIVKQLE
jgi:hypothetical protein